MAAETLQEIEAEDEEVTQRERMMRALGLGALLILATLAAYQQAWHAGFIWLDPTVLSEHVLGPGGWKFIWSSFDAPGGYQPLVYSSLRLEHLLWGANAAAFHWVNFTLHVLNALVLWRVLRLLDLPGAWLAAALFALHPVQVEAVAWIAARSHLLAGFFFLLALLAWQRFVAGERRGELKFYFATLACGVLAFLSHPLVAGALPLVLLLVSWWKRGAVSLARAVQVVPLVLFSAVMLFLHYRHGPRVNGLTLGLVERLLVAARDFWFYLATLCWPAHLSFNYPRWSLSAAQPADYLWLGALLLLVLLVVIARRWLGRGLEAALLFFALLLAPMLGFVLLETFRYSFVADRFVYLACIGPFALVAAALTHAFARLPRLRTFLLPLLALALLAPLGYRTWRQAAIYQNEETLWQATLAANPASWLAHHRLGLQELNAGRIEEAITHLGEAVRLAPESSEVHLSLANSLLLAGRGTEARRHYEQAVSLDPQNGEARTALGLILQEQGMAAEATAQYEEAVRLDPEANMAREQLGQLLVSQGRAEEGTEQLKAAVTANPESDQMRNELTTVLLEQGKPAEALEHAQHLVEANPADTTAQTNYGIILAELGREEEAITHFQKAIEADTTNPKAHYNLGNTFLRRRQVNEASEQYRKALEISPDYAAARLNLANTLVEGGQLNEAVSEYQKVLEVRPDYPAAHNNLSTALNHLGRYDEAFEHLRTAWKLEAEARKSAQP